MVPCRAGSQPHEELGSRMELGSLLPGGGSICIGWRDEQELVAQTWLENPTTSPAGSPRRHLG